MGRECSRMNQATNLIQWKNLTQEQKDEFDFENYKYKMQDYIISNNWLSARDNCPSRQAVYRLVIEPEKWYWCKWPDGCEYPALGKSFINEIENCLGVLPAKEHEKPKPEKTLEQKIKEDTVKWPDNEVRMLKEREGSGDLVINIAGLPLHINAQSMKGFAGYVYYHSENDWVVSKKPTKYWRNKTIQPVAVLFEKVKK